jgi:glycine oxidase
MSNFDYIVVGGGIIGMMTARELDMQGARVAIFERKTLGMESSWAAGGILSSMRPWAESFDSMVLSEHGKALYPYYLELLKQETEIDSEYIQSGLIIIDEAHSSKIKNWASNGNIALIEDEKNISCGISLPKHSVLLPDIAQLRPPRLLKALSKSLKQSSVSIYENTKITNLVTKNNRFQFVEFTGGKVSADAVIITAGVWSQSLVSNLSKDISMKPIRGQMLCVKADEIIIDKMILDGAYYLIPRKDGHILIGSTMEDVGFNNETTKSARQELLDWAYSISPVFSKAKPVSHWSGLRPQSITGKPFIGKMPSFKNIYINAGHFRKGILQAPASAKLIVDCVFGKTSFMDIENFNMEGFKKTLEYS